MILPPISWRTAVGLVLLIHFMKMKYVKNDSGWKDTLKAFLVIQVSMALAVLISWLFWLCGFGNH